jgi:hypothetical protein
MLLFIVLITYSSSNNEKKGVIIGKMNRRLKMKICVLFFFF